MAQNNNIQKDAALRLALQREGERLRMPADLTERVMVRVREEAAPSEKRKAQRRARLFGWVAVAAAVLVAVFVLVSPRLRESREMALYEGSYVEEDGRRVEDYHLIKADIHEALSMADQAEAFLKE